MEVDLTRWWRDVRPRLAAIRTSDPLSSGELERQLRLCVAPHIAPDSPESRLELPPAFKRYLDIVGPVCWLGQRIALDFLIYPAASVLELTTDALKSFGDEDDAGVAGAGLWIQFAGRGDRTRWFLCCDRARAEYGQVGTYDDDHPWMSGASRDPYSFDDWLRMVQDSRADRPWPTLLALNPGEVASLQSAMRAADPVEVLIAARDLAAVLTPDRAWSHTLHATSRVILVKQIDQLDPGTLIYDREIRAWLTEAGQVNELAGRRPILAEYGVLAWDDDRHELRFVQDASGFVTAFYRRAAAAGQAVLLVVELPSEDESVSGSADASAS